jgi:cytochrome c biogenesis protein CcmG, thiol:disulfide interchange protein DsbE
MSLLASPQMRRLLAALALIVATAALAGCVGLGGTDVSVIPPDERVPAPAFRVDSLDGSGEISLADYAGSPVALNFWASWCEPCEREMPALVEFAKETPRMKVVGLAVTDQPSASRAFARAYGVEFPLGVDRRGDTAATFGVTGLPVTVFLDEEGRVAQTAFGELTRQQLDGYAEELDAG